jgi:hypothetical protein
VADRSLSPDIYKLRERQKELEARIAYIEAKLGILQRESDHRDERDRREGREPYVSS